jgi:hypothetical protein
VIPGGQGVLATIGAMLAVVWHYWIAVVLVITAVIPATVMIFAGYLRKTQAPKYGRDE